MGDAARRAIMYGAIVRQAIDGAVKGEHLRISHLAFSVHSFVPSSHCLFFLA
jgi:hypothetical protein